MLKINILTEIINRIGDISFVALPDAQTSFRMIHICTQYIATYSTKSSISLLRVNSDLRLLPITQYSSYKNQNSISILQ